MQKDRNWKSNAGEEPARFCLPKIIIPKSAKGFHQRSMELAEAEM